MKFPSTAYNWISISGVIIAMVSVLLIIFLVILTAIFDHTGAYLGLFTFIILPVFLILGLVLIPIGMWYNSKKNRIDILNEGKWPTFDLNDNRIRNAAGIFILGSVIFILLTGVGSYEAFHYTESNEFCGKLCHKVMEPEYVAYANSSHARVNCVECHVGEGAGWFVKSKLSGVRQVHATITNSYPKPIPTPIKDLRPARETCEQCHWPEKFYAQKYRFERHYLADEQNSEWDIGLQMKTGPQFQALGLESGIHWHINSDIKIEYKSINHKRDTIPWVRYTNLKTGMIEEFLSPIADSIPLDELEIRSMDCMDCHNRPSHDYLSPTRFIDNAFTSGDLPIELPDLKVIAMEILFSEYEDRDSAMTDIEFRIKEYYEVMYPEILESKAELINRVVEVIQKEFSKNIFPNMKVSWRNYTNHLGHLESDGCYRCHSDQHTSINGLTISRDCNLCHSINRQGPPKNLEYAIGNESLVFKHPVAIKNKWERIFCAECHNELY